MQVNAAVETVSYPQSSHVPIETPVRKCVPRCGCVCAAPLRGDQPLNTLRFTNSVVFTPPECCFFFPRPAGYPNTTAAEALLLHHHSVLRWALLHLHALFLRQPGQAKPLTADLKYEPRGEKSCDNHPVCDLTQGVPSTHSYPTLPWDMIMEN